MMMYVEATYYKQYPTRAPSVFRERYRQYYRDLHARYKVPLASATLYSGSQYQFNELAYPLFDKLASEGLLKQLDLMVMAQWAHEFDPDYTTIGLHLAHRYQLNCNMFDLLSQGSLCSLTALQLILKLNSKKSLCFTLDQTTIPRGDAWSFVMPSHTAAAAILLSANKKSENAIEIVDIEIWSEGMLFAAKSDVISLILTTLNKHQIHSRDCRLSCRRHAAVTRALQAYRHHYPDFNETIEFDFLGQDIGGVGVLHYVHTYHTQEKTTNRRYSLLLDEDVESLTCGLMILELPETRSDCA